MAATDSGEGTWLEQAQAYRKRTGDDMREVYLAMLCFIDAEYPGSLDYGVRRLEKLYPDGLAAPYRGTEGEGQSGG